MTDYYRYGKELDELLKLRYAPIALKLLREGDEIPEGCLRPKRDLGAHLALCQAFAMVRRQRASLVLLKEDHWCVWPLISFGQVKFSREDDYYDQVVTINFIEDPQKAREFFEKSYPRLNYGESIGLALAPLDSCNFTPDLILIYARPAQLRSMLMAVKFKTGELLKCEFDAVDSCVYSTVPVLQNGNYRITVPDPGEYERALTDEDEMIFSVPAAKLEELLDGLNKLSAMGFGYKQLFMEMKLDFARPQFYDDLFKRWGLDQGEIWKRRPE